MVILSRKCVTYVLFCPKSQHLVSQADVFTSPGANKAKCAA
jgi:hypothetical protein